MGCREESQRRGGNYLKEISVEMEQREMEAEAIALVTLILGFLSFPIAVTRIRRTLCLMSKYFND